MNYSKMTNLQCDLLQKCKETGTPFDVVCYGLGRLSSCSTALYQFAALTAFDTGLEGVCVCVCVRVFVYMAE